MPLLAQHTDQLPSSRRRSTPRLNGVNGRRPASSAFAMAFQRKDYPGLETVLDEMKRLVKEYKGSPKVRDKAVDITSGIPNDPRTGLPNRRAFDNIASAIYDWMKTNIQYVRDPDGIEWLQTPLVTLKKKYGDCDDQSILAAALLSSIGVPTHFKVVKADPRKPEAFSHVYLEYQLNTGQWKPFDPTLHTQAGDGLSDKQIFESKIVPLSDGQTSDVKRETGKSSHVSRLTFAALIFALLGYGFYQYNYKPKQN